MKSLVLLLCLAQLWGCHSAPQGQVLHYRQLNCDDPETEEAALAAVDYINQNLPSGYKHTLNQIDKVTVWPRRPFGEVFEMEIDTLETTCHALDPTPVANCSVRQLTEHAVEGDCDFRLLKLNGQFSVVYAKCDSSPDSAEDVRKVCQDCPLLAPLNDTRAVHAADAALAAFNAQNNGSIFQLEEISRVQLVPLPPSTYVEFTMSAPDCVAKEATEEATCNPLAQKQYGFCKATLTEKLNREEVAVTCTVFQSQPVAPQPQPEGAEAAGLSLDVLPPLSCGEAASPQASPPFRLEHPLVRSLHPAHYDLRHIFMGVASMESASGEAGHLRKTRAVGAAAGPAVPLCPGRIRHFKV
ncbi:alpha-2-HS-glycoprotein [Saimiri boliviensis]|uniref:Alpha-2-HS-glycoprotein n=1 Tax=Saimiri boliviensis boliviensis TaxID=39432 RepID=A0A2K6RZQ6_SAIBB|nr:alpha-2-HS-glycoprotein [Saimiri boliviensis boliviensis]